MAHSGMDPNMIWSSLSRIVRSTGERGPRARRGRAGSGECECAVRPRFDKGCEVRNLLLTN